MKILMVGAGGIGGYFGAQLILPARTSRFCCESSASNQLTVRA